jgi:hypothetical protein
VLDYADLLPVNSRLETSLPQRQTPPNKIVTCHHNFDPHSDLTEIDMPSECMSDRFEHFVDRLPDQVHTICVRGNMGRGVDIE